MIFRVNFALIFVFFFKSKGFFFKNTSAISPKDVLISSALKGQSEVSIDLFNENCNF